jgi:hypothetical protein
MGRSFVQAVLEIGERQFKWLRGVPQPCTRRLTDITVGAYVIGPSLDIMRLFSGEAGGLLTSVKRGLRLASGRQLPLPPPTGSSHAPRIQGNVAPRQ